MGGSYRGVVTIFPNNRRALLAFLHDVVMAAVSLVVSLYLRLGNEIFGYEPRLTATYVMSFTLIASAVSSCAICWNANGLRLSPNPSTMSSKPIYWGNAFIN